MSTQTSKTMIGAAIGGIALLAAFPVLVGNPYYIHLVETILIYAILLFGLDIVVGYTGQVSLGHAGLFGVGSYVTGVLVMKLSAAWWLTIPASIAGAAIFGAILALPALRVTGPYLAMVTLAFGTIVQILINEMTFLTEGPMGRHGPPDRGFAPDPRPSHAAVLRRRPRAPLPPAWRPRRSTVPWAQA